MDKIKLQLQHATRWEDLPDPWKSVKTPRQIKIDRTGSSIKDPELLRLFTKFFRRDDLIPKLTGLHLLKKPYPHLLGTNSHTGFSTPDYWNLDGFYEEGIYVIDPKITADTKLYDTVPNEKPIQLSGYLKPPKDDMIGAMSAVKLKTYCDAVLKGQYANEQISKVKLCIVPDKESIIMDARYIIALMDAFLMLGFDKIYWGYSGSGSIYFSENNKKVSNPQNDIPAILAYLMPHLVTKDYDGFMGAKDVDMDTSLSVYYCFAKDAIVNADGSEAYFNADLKSNELPYMTEEQYSALQRMAKETALPVTEYVEVREKNAISTDLESYSVLNDIPLMDGVYKPVSSALKDLAGSGYPKMDDFPDRPIYDWQDVKGKTDVGTFQLDMLSELIKSVMPAISNDDLRPAMAGVILMDYKDNLWLAATNAFIVIMRNTGMKANADRITLGGIDTILPALEAMKGEVSSETATLKMTEDDYAIENKNGMYLSRVLSTQAPNINSVLPNDRHTLELDIKMLQDVLKKNKPPTGASVKRVGLQFMDNIDVPGEGKMKVFFDADFTAEPKDFPDKVVAEIPYRITLATHDPSYSDIALVMPLLIGDEMSDNQIGFEYDKLLAVVKLAGPKTTFGIKSNRSSVILDIPSYSDRFDMGRKPVATETKKKPQKQAPASDKAFIEAQIAGLKIAMDFMEGAERDFAETQMAALKVAAEFA